MALDISFKNSPTMVLVDLKGTLDTSTSPDLDKQLGPVLETRPEMLVFDLKDLKFISSSGLRILARAKKTLKTWGGSLMLLHLQPQIQEVFQIVKALPEENIFQSEQEMDEYLMARQRMKLEQ